MHAPAMFYVPTYILYLKVSHGKDINTVEPFGIVVVYLQKRDLEKNSFKDFRHFRTRNLTQTPKRLGVLYEVVAHLVKLCIKVVGAFKKPHMIRK